MNDQKNEGVSTQDQVVYRRRYVRVAVSTPVNYVCDGEKTQKIGQSYDLGGGGIRLATDEDLPLGTVLVLRFPVPGTEREIIVRGRIMLSYFNAETKQYIHGIAFTHIDPRDQEEIIRYVASEVQRLAHEEEPEPAAE